MTNLLAQQLHSFMWSHDHLAQHRFLFFEFSGLVLKIWIFLLLSRHPEFQVSKERFNKRCGGLVDLFVYVQDFGFHRVELLSEELHQFMILL